MVRIFSLSPDILTEAFRVFFQSPYVNTWIVP
jgi:hypothetical protein